MFIFRHDFSCVFQAFRGVDEIIPFNIFRVVIFAFTWTEIIIKISFMLTYRITIIIFLSASLTLPVRRLDFVFPDITFFDSKTSGKIVF